MDNSSNINKINESSTSFVEPVPLEAKNSQLSKVKSESKFRINEFKNKLRKTGISCLLAVGAIFAIFLVYLVFYATGLDTQIIPLSFKGYVVDSSIPLSNITVSVEGIGEVVTNDKGAFELQKLDTGIYSIAINTEQGIFTDSFSIQKNLFQYSFSKTFDIKTNQNLVNASIKGKFLNVPANYNFTGEFVDFFNQKSPIGVDGSFLLTNVKSKEGKLIFNSSNFKDIEIDLNLQDGMNEIPDIELNIAGDIEGTKISYVREKPVENFKIEVSNVSSNQILISNDRFLVKDLEVGRTYRLRISGDDIETRTYDVDIQSGTNLINDFKLVETETAVFSGTLTARGDNQFYKSSLDGMNLDQISNIRNLKPINAKVIDNKLFFQSDYERIDANFSISSLYPIYELDLNIKSEPKRLTTITENLGSMFPNYVSKKSINVIFDPADAKNKRLIQFMNIDGSNRKNIYSYGSDRSILNVLLSNDGTKAFFVEQVNETSQRLFRIDLKTNSLSEIAVREQIILYQISNDSNLVLFSSKRDTSSFYTLNTFNDTTSEVRSIVNNYEGSTAIFLPDPKSSILYSEYVNNRANLVVLNSDGSNAVSKNIFSNGTEIINTYVIENYIFFLTKNSLLVSHFDTPSNLKKVIESESITSSF